MTGTATTTSSIGDLLLTFGGLDAPSACRNSSHWLFLASGSAWRLHCQPEEISWKGYHVNHAVAGGWEVWLLGELYGATYGRGAKTTILDVAAGRKPAHTLNGHFLLLASDSKTGDWQVWTDRFGTFHAYYATDGERAAVGTFFPALAEAASRRRLDWLALGGFFSFGFFPEDRTFFDDVRILRPASHYVFDRWGKLLRRERYWDWRHEVEEDRSYDETVEQFADVFHHVIEDHTSGGRVAIPVSGGLDSRSTVAALNGGTRGGDRLWAYSYGYSEDSVEATIARQVARARGLPFQPFVVRPYLFKQMSTVVACLEGFQDVTQARQASVVEMLAQNADFVLAAHWGDVWLDDMKVGDLRRGADGEGNLHVRTLHKMHKRGRRWLLENALPSTVRPDEVQDWLLRGVRRELDRLDHLEDPDFRVKAYKTDQWSFRWTTASLRMFRAGAVPRLCFYDTRLADFLCTVPTDFLRNRRLQIDYLKRYAPDLARIKWQVYDTNVYRYRHFNTWMVPKRAVKKVWRRLTGKKVLQRNWEVQLLGETGRRGLQQWLLRPGLRLHEYVRPKVARELVDDLFANLASPDLGYAVSMLLTFSAWLEHYG